jgi:hypothetical protein
MLQLDHVVYAVRDLDAAAERWRRELGLDSVEGGRHAAWGTANRIVPLGRLQYVELIAVLDRERARGTAFGRSVLDRTAEGDGWLTSVVAAADLDAVAGRLGVAIAEGRRERPDGVALSWGSAAFDDPRRHPGLPFFIRWDVDDALHPGTGRAGHGVRADGIAWAEVGGDAGTLDAWLGGQDVGLRAVNGPPGLRRVAVATADGELVIA